MKSLSVKKIASVAAGAAMLGAAFAGAATVDPAVGNFKFMQNGQPAFKIVVGARAHSSDYWNAAKLAELFGNLAYSDRAVVADTSGLSCSGNATAGACTVTGKGVTLEITTPAGVTGQTGSLTVMTQLYDFLDVSQTTATTTRVNDASVALMGDGVNTGGYEVNPTRNPDVAWKGKIDNVGSYSVTEEERFFITGKSYYDTSDKAYVGDAAQIYYTVNFTDTLPYHVDVVNGSVAGRPTNDAYITENRNVKVRFLGGEYVITDFENSTTDSIALGSSAAFLQMKVGQSIKLGDKELKLVQISPIATTSSTLPPAYFEVLQNGTRVDYFSMNKDTSNYNKYGIILDVRDVFVGGGDTSYADVAAYASSITLTNGQKISFEGDDATTKLNDDARWVAKLNFETKIVGSTAVKSLKAIRLEGPASNKLKSGSSYDLIAKPIARQLKFLGVEAVDMDTLRVSAAGNSRYTVTNTTFERSRTGFDSTLTDGFNVTLVKSGYASAFQIDGKSLDTLYIDEYFGRILYKDPNSANLTYKSAENNTVDYYYPGTTLSNALRLLTNGTREQPHIASVNNTNTTAGLVGNTTNYGQLMIFNVTYIDNAGGESIAAPVTVNISVRTGVVNISIIPVLGASKYLVYNREGAVENSSTSSPILVNTNGTAGTLRDLNASSMKLRVYEPTRDNDPSMSTAHGYVEVDLFRADSNYLFNSSTTTSTLTLAYNGAATGLNSTSVFTNKSYEQGFVSPGGMVFDTLGLSEVKLKYPKRYPKASWWFGAPSTTNVTAGGATVTSKTLAEAESYALGGGYTIKVSSVAGAANCAGGGPGGALRGTATCSPAKAAVVNALNPASDPLVVMDSQAGGVGPAIVVGGPVVNTLSANTPGAAAIASAAGQSGVRVVGDKIFAYGYTAADTTDAVDSLIRWVAGQRDVVRGV